MKQLSPRERILIFNKPTVFGKISQQITKNITEEELEDPNPPFRMKIRLWTSLPFGIVDEFLRGRRPLKDRDAES